jgi:hypothetical protein
MRKSQTKSLKSRRIIIKSPKQKNNSLKRYNICVLQKAKPAEVGETRIHGGVKKKKVAPGRWKRVEAEKTKKIVGDKKEKKPKISDKKGQKKEALKTAIKGFLNTLTDIFAGKGGVETAAGEAERTGTTLGTRKQVFKKVDS